MPRTIKGIRVYEYHELRDNSRVAALRSLRSDTNMDHTMWSPHTFYDMLKKGRYVFTRSGKVFNH